MARPLKVTLLRLGATIVVGAGVVYGMVQLGPQAPGDYEGIEASESVTPTASAASSPSVAPTVTNTPPPGFPTQRRPPRKIAVGEGEPQPIDTKFGLRYTVPADWRNFSTGVTGWGSGESTVTYGAVADYGRGYCPAYDSADLATTGMTGRNGVDPVTAARDAIRQAEVIYAGSVNPDAVITYSDPINFEIDGEPAVRITANATGLTVESECDPPSGSFDIVTTTGFVNATVAVFMIALDREIDGALDESSADQIIETIEKSPTG